MIHLDCECGRSFDVADSKAGQTVACPRCRREFIAPTIVLNRTWQDEQRAKDAKLEDIFSYTYYGLLALGCLFKIAFVMFLIALVIGLLIWIF